MIVTDTVRHRPVAQPRRVLRSRIGWLAIALGAIAVGLVSLRTSEASPGFFYLTESTISTIVGLTAGWGLVAVGLETLRRGRRRRFGYLLAAAGIAWFLPVWSDPAISVPAAFTIGLAFSWLYPALLGHALFTIAGTSPPARVDPVVAVGYLLLVIGLGIVPALGFDPGAVGCGLCPANLIEIGGAPGLVDDATRVATVLAVGWSLSAALVLAYRLARSGPMSRQVRAPIMIPGIGFLVLVAITLGRSIVEAVPPTDPMDRLLRLAQATALIMLAIGVAYEWLQAAARAQLDALRAARRRIVEAGDARRRQLERDLHDGAQQHLIALAINLRFVDRGAGIDAWIDDAAAELRLAMDDLRDVAHGIYPTVLGDEGFAAAVDALAEASTVPITIVDMVEERFDAAIEVAAYHVVADVVRGGIGPLRIRAWRAGERLTVEVTASQIPKQVAEEVADRVGAVDGSLESVRNGEASMTLIAEIPCGQ